MENKWSTKPGQEWIKCPHCEITFRIRKPSQEGQAGVSAERLLDMILKLAEDIDQELWGADGSKEINARGRIVPLISAFADTLLATAPPEQAAPLREEEVHNAYLSGLAAAQTSEGEKSVAGGRVSNPTAARNPDSLEQAQCCCNASWLDLDISDCPIHGPKAQHQPASAGALSAANVEKFAAELHEVYWQESIRQRDTTGLIPRHRRDYNELSEDIKDYDRALARFVLQRLAAHDQKVRAEVPSEIWLDEAARRVELWLCVDLDLNTDPHDWGLDEWAQVRAIVKRAIASMWQPSTIAARAAPAASKPEAGKP